MAYDPEYARRYREANKEKNRIYQRAYYQKIGRSKNTASARKSRYQKIGWTVEGYEQAYLEQNGLCAICKNPETTIDPRNGAPRLLAADHSHETGKPRGLLCYRCNSALGFLGENMESIISMLDYVVKHRD